MIYVRFSFALTTTMYHGGSYAFVALDEGQQKKSSNCVTIRYKSVIGNDRLSHYIYRSSGFIDKKVSFVLVED